MEENEGHPNESAATAAAVEKKHAAMLERLSNRHRSRLAAKAEGDSTASKRSTELVLNQFSQSKDSIETRLSRIRESPESSKKPDLEQISEEIAALEKTVAEQSYFLPPYEVRSCLNAVAHIKETLDLITPLVIPRKKFSFKNKPSTKPTAPPPNKKPDLGSEPPAHMELMPAPGFRNRENEALVKEFGSSERGEFILSNLRNCEVRLKGCVRALFIDKVINCRIYGGVVMSSVLIEETEGSVFVVASHQIRIHNAKNCVFYLRVRSRPIIEDCSEVRFSPYCLSYEGLEKELADANLDQENGNWACVDDFKWLRATQSPNWSVLPENERMGTIDIA